MQGEQIAATYLTFVMIERFGQEFGDAQVQGFVAYFVVVRHGDHDDGYMFEMGDASYRFDDLQA